MSLERRIQTLEMVSVLQKIEIEIFKGKEATKRWGTPEGNPVAIVNLRRAEKAIRSYKWPEEFGELVSRLESCLAKYRGTLEEYEITYGSMYKTQLENAFYTLEEIVYSRLYN